MNHCTAGLDSMSRARCWYACQISCATEEGYLFARNQSDQAICWNIELFQVDCMRDQKANMRALVIKYRCRYDLNSPDRIFGHLRPPLRLQIRTHAQGIEAQRRAAAMVSPPRWGNEARASPRRSVLLDSPTFILRLESLRAMQCNFRLHFQDVNKKK